MEKWTQKICYELDLNHFQKKIGSQSSQLKRLCLPLSNHVATKGDVRAAQAIEKLICS